MIVVVIVDVVIEEMATGQRSSTVFNRVANYNDAGPSFYCYLQGGRRSVGLNWEKYGSHFLPFGVSQLGSKLVWSRPLEFEDTGLYMCTYSDKQTMLRLAVKRKSLTSSNRCTDSFSWIRVYNHSVWNTMIHDVIYTGYNYYVLYAINLLVCYTG